MPERRADESALPPDVDATVVTVGTFDGVHIGHQHVLDRLAERSDATGCRSVLVTFEPHPLEIVNPSAAPLLLTVGAEKMEVLAESRVDYHSILPFTPALRSYSPEQFVTLLERRMRLRELLIGYDHGFGRGRAGDVETLQAIGARRGIRVEVVSAVTSGDGRPISSTSIRRAVAGGDLARAAAGLGRAYSVCGRVISGEQRGRRIGFPTLNLGAPPHRKLLPPEGVYAVRAQTPGGTFGGMMNLGPRPTFGDPEVGLEAHLFDVRSDWYGAWVRLDFVARLRDTQRFPSTEALVAQLRRDEETARRALTSTEPPGNV